MSHLIYRLMILNMSEAKSDAVKSAYPEFSRDDFRKKTQYREVINTDKIKSIAGITKVEAVARIEI